MNIKFKFYIFFTYLKFYFFFFFFQPFTNLKNSLSPQALKKNKNKNIPDSEQNLAHGSQFAKFYFKQ